MADFIALVFAFLTSLFSNVISVEPAHKDYVGALAAEAAYSAVLPGAEPVKPKKPIDPNCSTCRGTGKVKSGDGLGWSPCPTCQAEDVTLLEAPQAPKAEVAKPSRLPYQVK